MEQYFPTTDSSFSTVIVKTNLPRVLRGELMSKQPYAIYIGTITDPYQPCEASRLITRRVLESLIYLPPKEIHILTKGTLIVRDIDMLKELSTMAKVYVSFTITTLSKRHVSHIEPHAPNPWLRLKAMKVLADNGITVGVSIAPIMPGINDNIKTVKNIWETARYHGASFFFIDALKLERELKKYFFKAIGEYMPEMLKTYYNLYRNEDKPISLSIYVKHMEKLLNEQNKCRFR